MNAAFSARRRIYSETLAWDALLSADVLDLLQHYSLELVAAVRPWEMDSLALLLEKTGARGIPTCVWPMLSDADGRWISAANGHVFERFAESLWTQILSRRKERLGILFDLEPPIAELRTLVSGALSAFLKQPRAPENMASTQMLLSRVARRFSSRGVEICCALVPAILWDTQERPGFQYLLGTPVDADAYDVLSPMLYTSMIEGYSRGLLRRADALALLAHSALRARALWGPRASLSLGVVGKGALGNEPVYRDSSELEMDVAALLASGIRDLALFDLGGVLARSSSSAWLEAFTGTHKTLDLAALRTWRAKLLSLAAKALAIGFAPSVPLKKSP